MAITRGWRGVRRSGNDDGQADAARAPTSSALGFPSARGGGATGVPRSAGGLAAVLVLLAALGGCDPYVQGNGVYAEEQRPDPGDFTGIHVESGVEAIVTAGASARSVTVSGDANVVPYIETQVQSDGGRRVLHVWISRAFSGTIPPRAWVEVPVLEYAAATEGARITAKAVAAPAFEVVADDGASVVLEGAAAPAGDSIDVTLGSRAVLNAGAYEVSGGASVALSGASSAKLHSDGPVSGTVSGGSQLDNLLGAGDCTAVAADGTSKLSCL